MRRAVLATCLLLLTARHYGGAQGESAFEVASIKREPSSQVPVGIRPIGPGGQFHAVMTVHDLVRVAYGAPLALLDSQVVGGPGWINVDRFDITAKFAGARTDFLNGPPAHLLDMIRTLLADRFALRTRRETRRLQVYDLVLEKRGVLGPRLRPTDGACVPVPSSPSDSRPLCGFSRFAPGQISARGMTLDVFGSGISPRSEIERIVRNRTGLSDRFDLDLEYMPGLGTASDPAADAKPTLFTAIREQLGLRLQTAVGPVEVIVIESVERPTED
jgi:uncharacterized protein (TIGR03435 family)